MKGGTLLASLQITHFSMGSTALEGFSEVDTSVRNTVRVPLNLELWLPPVLLGLLMPADQWTTEGITIWAAVIHADHYKEHEGSQGGCVWHSGDPRGLCLVCPSPFSAVSVQVGNHRW